MTAIRGEGARFMGQRVLRREDLRLLTGQGQFVDDIVLPGMLHATFVRSTVARARIAGIDIQAARALPGVHAIFTAADLSRHVKAQPYMHSNAPGAAQVLHLPLADQDVRFVGDPVVLVIATDRYIAEDAAELVVVDYEPEDPVVDFLTARDAPPVHAEIGTNVGLEFATPDDPGLEKAFAGAAHVITETFSQQRHACVPMETRGVVASWSAGEMTVHLSTQIAHMARRYIGLAVGLGDHQLRVIARDVGGGFGLKAHVDREEIGVIAAAKLLKVPVKWIEDRVEHLTVAGHARQETVTCRMGFDAQGRIVAAHFDHKDDVGSFPLVSPGGIGMMAAMYFTGPYRVPRYGFRAASYFTNTAGRCAYRGPWMTESLIRESMMEIAARQMGMDPFELRRRNVITAAEQPFTTPTGLTFYAVTPAESMEQALKMLDLDAFRAMQAQARAEGRLVGLGASVYIEPSSAGSNPQGVGPSDVAEIRIEPDGRVNVQMSAGTGGNSIETTMAQLIADELGVDMEQVSVRFGDTAHAGFGAGSGGSRQAEFGGSAAKLAAAQMRAKVLKIAGHLLELDPGELEMVDGEIRSTAGANKWISLGELAGIAYLDVLRLPAGMEAGLETRARYHRGHLQNHSNATHLCVCEIDRRTGQVRILRWLVSEDCGVMINPMIVEGQVAGGVVQGIGGVLYEHAAYDEDGNPIATSFKDYLMPLALDVPEIEFGHLVTPGDAPNGAKGIGEGGAIVAPAALLNAVADALAPLGVRVNTLPLSPSRILDLIASAGP
ncbi:MAG: xanthine dehydrogenase family protein molybdopterin-binding subunit [Gammaproteobacteria bacterium]